MRAVRYLFAASVLLMLACACCLPVEGEGNGSGEPPRVTREVHLAEFRDNNLMRCADYEYRFSEGLNFDPEAHARAGNSAFTRVRDACGSAFLGRQAYASCHAELQTNGSVAVQYTLHERYYDIRYVTTDRAMQSCVQAGGRWTQLR